MNWVTALGYAAAFCSTVSFLPQAWRIIKTRDTTSISTPTYALTCTGFALWLAYGFARSEWPLVLTNGICLVLSLFILTMTILPREAKERVAETLDPESG